MARIEQGQQRMRVSMNGMPAFEWPVSTVLRGRRRARRLAPGRADRDEAALAQVPRLADAPRAVLPGGDAIHGAFAGGAPGRRASHGCIRLSPGYAASLFRLARNDGGAAAVIGN